MTEFIDSPGPAAYDHRGGIGTQSDSRKDTTASYGMGTQERFQESASPPAVFGWPKMPPKRPSVMPLAYALRGAMSAIVPRRATAAQERAREVRRRLNMMPVSFTAARRVAILAVNTTRHTSLSGSASSRCASSRGGRPLSAAEATG